MLCMGVTFVNKTSYLVASVVACVFTKVGNPNQGSRKHKGALRDSHKMTCFKQ